ncbi:292_t:CDS:1 [Scutellospora calospora]|uniref:292_t:CDS:1 n=1 Tax=Scutellospora calospora TaxID=85575 RepID=A0ACA9KRE6_9GLOM|nr:292_t:CDS:1 [Scutellospora calospora]
MDKNVIRKNINKNPNNQEQEEFSNSNKSSKKVRSDWDPNWSKIYPWLKKSEDANSTITLYCTWCKDAGKSNQFTEGTQALRKQTIERHLIINDHQKAIIARDNQQTKLMQGFT